MIFDHLKISWKTGLDKVYNFLEIYETQYLKKQIRVSERVVKKAKARNNYDEIHKQELARKVTYEKRLEFYKDLLITKPTLQVTLVSKGYSMSFDMNGTIALRILELSTVASKEKAQMVRTSETLRLILRKRGLAKPEF